MAKLGGKSISGIWFGVALTILSLVVILTSVLLVGLIYYRNRVLPGVAIAGRDVGNLTKAELITYLTELESKTSPTLEMVYENYSWTIPLRETDLKIEKDLTADTALAWGKQWEAWQKRDIKRNQGVDLPIIYNLDEDLLQTHLESMGEDIWQPALEPELTASESGILVQQGTLGRKLESDRTTALIHEQLRAWKFAPVQLPVLMEDLRVEDSDLMQAKNRAEQLQSKTIELMANEEYKANSIIWNGDRLVSLVKAGEGFRESRLDQEVALLAEAVNRDPKNAVFVFDEETQRVKEFEEELPGLELDQTATKGLLLETLNELERAATDSATIELPLLKVDAKVGVAQINDLGIEELIGEGESSFKGSIPGRIHNIGLASERINGVLVPPGEVISFNELVGEISAKTGYQSSYVIQNGRTVLGDGGGVCQVSTTLFRAGLNSGLPIEERRAHSYRVGYYEQDAKPGLDATIYSPTVDLKILNDTPGYILIQTEFDKENAHLSFKLYGKSDGRVAEITDHRVWDVIAPPPPLYEDDPSMPAGQEKQIEHAAYGTKAAFDWVVKNADGSIKEEKTFYSTFQPWRAVYLRGVGPAQ